MKSLKFSAELVPLILSGEKTMTWRFWDDKDLDSGDENGHESYTDSKAVCSGYYQREVNDDTPVAIVKFEIVEKM